MSTVTTTKLTTEQLAANKAAIMNFIADAYINNDYDLGTCILLPEFQLVNGEWQPTDSAIRSANNPNDPNAAFIRLGSLEIGDGGRPVARYTNNFMAQGDMALSLKLQRASAGKKFAGKLVIEESLKPFSTTNPARDAKVTPDGIACTFTGTRMVEGELQQYSKAPIYRRTVHTTNANKQDVLIAHTNGDEISTAARARWNNGNKANSNALKNAAMNSMKAEKTPEQELAELKLIKAKDRTPEQKMRIAELTEQLEEA